MLLLAFIGLCSALGEYFQIIRKHSDDLHRLTDYSTFYELYNVNETASFPEIKRAYLRAQRKKSFPGMSKANYDHIIQISYSVLRDMRGDYDYMLANSSLFAHSEERNYKNYMLVIVAAIAIVLVSLDALLFFVRYVKYNDNLDLIRLAKKRRRESDEPLPPKPTKGIQKPSMYTLSVFTMVRRKIFG